MIVNVSHITGLSEVPKVDIVAVEEPLEIRMAQKTISITMRTPGHDFELASGFLYTEGILKNVSDINKIDFCGPSKNVVRIDLDPSVNFDLKNLERHFYTSSSCGVCGKTSLEALKVQAQNFKEVPFSKVKSSIIHDLPRKLRRQQTLFNSTGGIHACALFDSNGRLFEAREDVGRHNALDKLIGFYFLENQLPLNDKILLVSGRASFELIQKAHMAGIKFFAAVGAPSSLAVELAKDSKMTLIGFVRDGRFNIYCGEERIEL